MNKGKLIFTKGAAAVLAALMVLTVAPYALQVKAADFALTVTGDSGYTQDETTGNITISQNGTYTVTGTGAATTSSVTVTGCTANITISDVNIAQTGGYAFKLSNNATVNLTLVGNNTLTCSTNNGAANRDISYAGLSVNEGNTVTILGSGKLTAQGSGSGYDYFGGAGIGGDSGYNCGTVNITDGTVDATGGFSGAGIGGGYTGQGVVSGSNGGTINISGGTVTANAQRGAGIGGGWADQSGGGGCTINISGGVVTANGGYGAGIGGGEQGAGGTVSISGGTVIATGGTYNKDITGAAGIGVGLDGTGGTVIISDGMVTANGGKLSSGIGSSISCSATGSVSISGGTVIANGGGGYNGGGGGAGIGGGEGVAGGTVAISGGAVTANGGSGSGSNGGGAGIGGGSGAPGGNVSISGVGTTVTATATSTDRINDIGSGYSSIYIYPPLSSGSLTVGDANVSTAPLPMVTLELAGTNADTTNKLVNCVINGSGAGSLAATYYAIDYRLNSGTNDAGNPSVYKTGTGVATLHDPIKSNVAFGGWYTDSSFSAASKVTAIGTAQTGVVTLYAQWLSKDATLSGLAVSGVALSPAFSSGTIDYTASVPNSVTSVTVTPTVNDGGASIHISSGGNDYSPASGNVSKSIPLTAGVSTEMDIAVTAQDGITTKTYKIKVTRASVPVPTGGGYSEPSPAAIDGTQCSDGTFAATISSYDADPTRVSTVTVNFTGSTIVTSSSVLHDALGSGSSLTLTQSAATADEQKQIAAAADKIGFSPLLVLEFNLARIGADGSSTPVHSFTGNVTVTLKLTDVQLAAISNPSRAKICYYDPETGALTDMKAVFDLTGKTVTFMTNHFSSYLLATGNPTGVSYQAHVQNIGWQKSVANGAQAGTSGQSLRVEAVSIELTGDMPTGASIIYQAHVQSIGWQREVCDGTNAGTSEKSLRVEALRMTLAGFDGYAVKYRAHVQNIGWQDWVTVQNGADLSKAGIAGTTGRSLRIEAVEIEIVKV